MQGSSVAFRLSKMAWRLYSVWPKVICLVGGYRLV